MDGVSRHRSPWFRWPAWDNLPVSRDDGVGRECAIVKQAAQLQLPERRVIMSDPLNQQDWTKPAAMAIPKGGFSKAEQGRYGPIFPKTPACYGFSILAKIIAGRENVFYEYVKNIEKTVSAQPDC